MSYEALKVIEWHIRPLKDHEHRAVHKGPRGAQCKWHELRHTAAEAAHYAERIGAKSWDIVPLKGQAEPQVGIKFYNREGHGMCGPGSIETITGHKCGKNDFWFDELPDPHWLDREKGVRDKSEGIDWHPEYA